MSQPRKFLENLVKPFFRHRDKGNEEDLEAIAAREQKHFPYEVLAAATRQFNVKNKLGEGGFGTVYKGRLEDGREVAVKRLARGSRQGVKEFRNEAMLLSRVQHKNVVNLYGYCADDRHPDDKLLVYEYLSHQSLDKILFNKERKEELDWKKRHDIIIGVARGLLYLHEDSHTTIIHRDIKASNILLDDKWAPKIADFGMARLYPEDRTHVNTRVAGTNGYMAPEYVMHGQLSAKADVFSFGVVVLELISGMKNSTFTPQADAQSLLEWAWKLHKRRQTLEMMDASLKSTAVNDQVALCVQVGLLCTQADPKLRPDMRRVVVILSKKPSTLEEPTKPGFPGSRYRRLQHTRKSSSHTTFASASPSAASTSTFASTSTSTSKTTTISPRQTSNEIQPA